MFRNVIKDALVCALGMASRLSCFGVILVAVVEAFGPKVPRVTKRFVDGLKGVTAGHEDLTASA